MRNRAHRMFALLLAVAPGALVAIASCGGDPDASDAGAADAARADAAAPADAAPFDDAGTPDGAPPPDAAVPPDASAAPDAATPPDAAHRADAGAPDASASADVGAGADAGLYGFTIRIPQERTIPVVGPGRGGTTQAWDIDYVCTFRYQASDGFFYLQSTPVQSMMMGGTEYRTEGGWLSFGGVVTPAAGALYDYGGNHHNDSMDLDYQNKRFRYYHSSFGFGWRSCRPPDCLQVYQGTTLLEDGCEADRKLPVVCVAVEADGTVAPLVDTFKKCLGNPNSFDGGS